MNINSQTLALHNKGWTAKAACARWRISYGTYIEWCNSDRKENILNDLINGIEDLSATRKAIADLKRSKDVIKGFGMANSIFEDLPFKKDL